MKKTFFTKATLKENYIIIYGRHAALSAIENNNRHIKNIYLVKGVFESLDNAALSAVKQSRWIPAKQQGKRIGVWVNIPVSFKLK